MVRLLVIICKFRVFSDRKRPIVNDSLSFPLLLSRNVVVVSPSVSQHSGLPSFCNRAYC
jgi:hypothetical protein